METRRCGEEASIERVVNREAWIGFRQPNNYNHSQHRKSKIKNLRPWAGALASALLLVLSLPGFDLWWLAWIGLVPLFAVLASDRKLGRARAFLLGEITGTIYYAVGCYWVAHPMVDYGGLSLPVAALLTILGASILALFLAAACLAIRDLVLRGGAVFVLSAPVWYLLAEWARLSFTSIGWNSIAYTQSFHPSFIQFARISGYSGISLLVIAINAAVALCFASRSQNHFRWAGALVAVVVGVLLISNHPGIGYKSNKSGPGSQQMQISSEGLIPFVIVQPEIPIDMEGGEASNQEALAKVMAMTDQILQDPEFIGTRSLRTRPPVVIWPESSLFVPLEIADPTWQAVAQFCRARRIRLVFNTVRVLEGGRAFNTVGIIDARGELAAEYRKIHLLPFGEYVPLRSIVPWLARIPALSADLTPGNEVRLLPLGSGINSGPQICSESAYPDLSRQMTADGADILINVSNDSWFNSRVMARQHLAHSILRAVENSRPLLQVTNGGISARVSPNGTITESWPALQERAGLWLFGLPDTVPPLGWTWYTLWGDWLTLISILGGAGAYVVAMIRARSRSSGRILA